MIAFYLVIILLAASSKANWDEVKTLPEASTYCSLRLFHSIRDELPTYVYSPYCIHSALSMTLLGARGETAKEIIEVLSLGSIKHSTLHEEYQKLIEKFYHARDVELYTANALFVNPKFNIEKTFINDAKTYYHALASNFDLSDEGGPEKIVNDFVKEQTKGQIESILEDGSINDDTALILVNTIFFNGTWLKPFPKYNTRKLDFERYEGNTTKMDFMIDSKQVNFKRFKEGRSLVELAFQGNRFALYILLPRNRYLTTMSVLEFYMKQENIDYMVGKLQETEIQLQIPKFRIDSNFELNKELQKLGMMKAFSKADFGGISKSSNLYISDVIHKATIEVSESGTVASAATAVSISRRSLPHKKFIANRPFIFFLRDKETKQILFRGKFSG